MASEEDKEVHKAPPKKYWPPIPNEDPEDDAINDERQWKACPMYE